MQKNVCTLYACMYVRTPVTRDFTIKTKGFETLQHFIFASVEMFILVILYTFVHRIEMKDLPGAIIDWTLGTRKLSLFNPLI